jgi:predicted Zn finger-like uncharacterized protein
MLTECPSCLTVFRVTGAILKMGHGQVRCGKCRTQFDALDSLLDDTGEDEKNPVTQNEASSPHAGSAIEADAPAMGEDIVMEGTRIEISGTYRVPDDATAAHSSNAANQIVHEHVVIDRGAPLADNLLAGMSDTDSLREVPDEQVFEINVDDGEPVADAAQHLMPDSTSSEQAPVPRSQRIWKRGRQQAATQSAAADTFDAELNALTQTPKAPTLRAGWWTAVSVGLVFVLIAQVIHHHRDPLVRSPKWGETVSRVYRALGLNLTPQWDLHAYELQQWGVISDASARDALRVRASVTNTAAYAQPYPFVKLALEDRWGSIVAMREFAPEEYLPSIATANRMMAPRQRTNAEIVIVDPGADAVSFQIRACLPQGHGIVCSDDPSVGE